MSRGNQHEKEAIEKQITQFEGLVNRPLWKDILTWFVFSAIFVGGTRLIIDYRKDILFDGPYYLKVFLFVIVGTAIIVPFVRYVNRASLKKLRKKYDEMQ